MKKLLLVLLALPLLFSCGDGGSLDKEITDVMIYDGYTGKGTYTWQNPLEQYIGEFKDGKKHGQGTLTYANLDNYVGEYKDDKIHGQGIYTLANGDKYVGEWKDNMMHGQGTYTHSDGRVYKGLFENDMFLGEKSTPLKHMDN